MGSRQASEASEFQKNWKSKTNYSFEDLFFLIDFLDFMLKYTFYFTIYIIAASSGVK